MVNDQWPPLAEVRRGLRVEWYRCPIAPARLRELMRRSDARGWFQAGGHLALFACTAALVILFWSQQLWLAFALALFAHGTIGTFFRGLATHELNHKTVFRTKCRLPDLSQNQVTLLVADCRPTRRRA